MIRGTMTPDTYKPVLRVSVLPMDKKTDGFQMYNSAYRLKGTIVVLIHTCVTIIYTWLTRLL